ncbi:MarR family winged helix-turn-helix transcriptional regulator [Paenibacillus durus]|uniref:MarR family winged helix-turn-helix transcriptional regulator n=1 Tax=Paenibacillus durus TaxID=44251 RepID=UPI0005A641E8|nr:MarR family transcriptional regulator [Paenibacillus durus]
MGNFNFDLKDIPKKEDLLKYSNENNPLNINAIQACLYLIKTTDEILKIVDSQFQKYGVSDGKFSILMTLYNKENHQLIPSELSSKLNVTRATISGLLDGLEKDMLVERCKHPSDGRMLTIKITEKGVKLMDELCPKHFALLSRLLGSLESESLKSFIENLKHIRIGIKE